MLTKEISEVEEEIVKVRKRFYKAVTLKRKTRFMYFQDLKVLKQKLSTLKSAQAKFDKFNKYLDCDWTMYSKETQQVVEDIQNRIDELSSKQEGKC